MKFITCTEAAAQMGITVRRIQQMCKNGEIQNCCHPNALMTLKEYLVDYASEETRKIGLEMIDREVQRIPRKLVHDRVVQYLGEIEQGARDFRF